MFLRNRMALFQGRSIALDLTAELDGVQVMSGHVTALASMQISDADFTPAADMEPVAANATRVSSGIMAGMIVSHAQPRYPAEAKQKGISGIVVLHAMIGRDGRIQSLHIISTPDASLAIATVAAVRRWVYKPYMLNGVPTEVETTINVNFTIGH